MRFRSSFTGLLIVLTTTALAEAKDKLFEAAAHHDALRVKRILATGADINHRSDPGGLTALLIASYVGDVGIVRELLAHKADPNIENADHELALHACAASANFEIVQMLINAGSQIDHRDQHKRTPLIVHSQQGHSDTVSLLLTKRADVNAFDQDAVTALHVAAANGHREVVDTPLRAS